MRVIGSAGHVDHGKSTLVERLSGINPDRLAEEQRRQMTIDLGFAWLNLPDGETIGIVDVPGHRDFIENMLAGVGGIDGALLLIAADEGIMPQTREHLAILRLLAVRSILVVISKIDLIDDPEWIELVRLEVEDLLLAHQLADAPIVEVSAQTGAGIDQLLEALGSLLRATPERVDYGAPRLPIDRVFVIGGFGTVVTGTLTGGALRLGDRVELQPSGRVGRIRGLQSYKQTVERAETGSRVAVNIAGLGSDEIRRGDVLAHPGRMQATTLADAHVQLLPDISRPLRHNAQVKFFCGAAESMANVRLLDAETLGADQRGWLQIRLREPCALARGDRFVLRYPSPAQTLGGGVIVDAQPRGSKRRFRAAIIRELEMRLSGSPGQRLALAAAGDAPMSLNDLQKQLGSSADELETALREALDEGLLRPVGEKRYWAAASWQKLANRAVHMLQIHHRQHPLRLGMARAELRSRLNTRLGLLDQIVDGDDRLCAERGFLRLSGHVIRFSPQQRASVDRFMRQLQNQAYTPPAIDEMNALIGEDVVRSLLDTRQLVKVNDRIAFAADAYDRMLEGIRRHIREHAEIDARTLRDLYGTSRKYAIALLERLDSLGVTRRVGDARVAGPNL